MRLAEIEWAVAQGAREIDIVITRQHVLQGNWKELYEEVSQTVFFFVRLQRALLQVFGWVVFSGCFRSSHGST
jgi:deoxyribose-phosphate aldolase